MIAKTIGKLLGMFMSVKNVLREAGYSANFTLPNERVDVASLIESRRRDIILHSTYLTGLQEHGFNAERADQLLELSERLAGITELVTLRKREEIDFKTYLERANQVGISLELAQELLLLQEIRLDADTIIRAWRRQIKIAGGKADYFDDLRHQGFTEDRIELMKKVTEYFPTPTDLITFAVREVYTPDIVEKYGQLEDLPPKFITEAKKAGLPEEQAKNYWAAHWILPSVGQGYEMLHRRIISEEDLMTLMRTQDIMPFWRKPLMDISYRPFTRVDVRRMNKAGVLDREEVKSAYMDYGFDSEKAEKMTDFTIKYNEETPEAEMTQEEIRREELRGLTRSALIKQYKNNLITKEQTVSFLKQIGFPQEVADMYVALAEFDNEENRVSNYLKAYRRMFINGVISFNETSDLLDELNLPASYKEHLLDIWDLETIGKPSQPSKTELGAFVKKGIIEKETYIEGMKNLGYAPKFIDWYLLGLGFKPEKAKT